MELGALCQQLEELDLQIVDLLERRAEIAGKVGTLSRQQGVSLPAWHAERDTLRRVVKLGRGTLTGEELRKIYEKLLSACGRLLSPQPPVVACLGPAGTFTHLAASRCFRGHAQYELLPNVAEVFRRLSKWQAQYGVITVGNSIGGPVAENLDLLASTLDDCSDKDNPTPLTICAETSLKVQHCLLGIGRIEELKSIHSHQQAFDQCRGRIARMIDEYHLRNVQLVAESSTAEAAKRAADDRTVGAIAHRLAAQLWPLKVLRENMEDDPTNTTRFLILARQRPPRGERSRTWIWFRTRHEPGALVRALSPVAKHNLNMTLIMSRPVRNQPGSYSFFMEFDGYVNDPSVEDTLEEMRAACLPDQPKVLGSYPQDVRPEKAFLTHFLTGSQHG